MKKKTEQKKENPKPDSNLLFDVLMQGGTYSDYRDILQDRSMPQENQPEKQVTEDDFLAVWIIGKDEQQQQLGQQTQMQQQQYACGGKLHQGYNSFMNYPKGDYIGQDPLELYQNVLDLQGKYGTPEGSDKSRIPISDKEQPWYAKGQYDSDRGAWEGTGNTLSSIGTVGYTLADMGIDSYNNTKRRIDDAQNKINFIIDDIGQQDFGVGDNAYLASQFDSIRRFEPTTLRQNGAMSSGEGLLNAGQSIFKGATTGAQVGGVPGAIIGGAVGLLKGGVDWFLNQNRAKKAMSLNNLKGAIANSQTDQKFNLTLGNSGLLRTMKQLEQPYHNQLGAFGGTMKNRYDAGGYLNSHYDYITDPLVKVNAGGTHQENPNEGVQVSVDPDGQPNLVEEGETIIDNGGDAYVFSDRIVADKEILKSHLLPVKFAGKTYADISKEIDRIIEEHKTDEISKRTFEEMINRLQQAQEDQKFQEKQQEVEQFIDGLSDDEKAALEQQMAEEVQQQAMQEQQMQEQAMQEQAAQEQAMQQQSQQGQVADEAMMQGQAPEEAMINPSQMPSRYDEIAQRSAMEEAANQGMFGYGGILQNGGYGVNRNPSMTHDVEPITFTYIDGVGYTPVVNEPEKKNTVAKPSSANEVFGNDNGNKKLKKQAIHRPGETAVVGYYTTDENGKGDSIYFFDKGQRQDSYILNSIINGYPDYRPFGMYGNGAQSNIPTVTMDQVDQSGQNGKKQKQVSKTKQKPKQTRIQQQYTLQLPAIQAANEGVLLDTQNNGIANVHTSPEGPSGKELRKAGWKKDSDGNWIRPEEEGYGERPDYLKTWMRYAPAIGSGVRYLSDLLGITNRPDYSHADELASQINGMSSPWFLPLGNYMNTNPFDETFHQNVIRSAAESSKRASQNNSSGNAGAALAAINSINNKTSSSFGDLALQSAQFNQEQMKAVDEYNAEIAKINASLSMDAQEKRNATAYQKALLYDKIATMKQNIDDINDAAKSQNESAFFDAIGDIGRENFIMNQINSNEGLYYYVDDNGVAHYKAAYYGLTKEGQEQIDREIEQNNLSVGAAQELKNKQKKDILVGRNQPGLSSLGRKVPAGYLFGNNPFMIGDF